MINPFSNHSVSIINKKWDFLRKNIKIKHIPRKDEYIYLEDEAQYFVVLNVVYNINKKQGIFIVVDNVEQPPIQGSVSNKKRG